MITPSDEIRVSPSGPFAGNVPRMLARDTVRLTSQTMPVGTTVVWSYTAPDKGRLTVQGWLLFAPVGGLASEVQLQPLVNGTPPIVNNYPAPGTGNQPPSEGFLLAAAQPVAIPIVIDVDIAAGDVITLPATVAVNPGALSLAYLSLALTTH